MLSLLFIAAAPLFDHEALAQIADGAYAEAATSAAERRQLQSDLTAAYARVVKQLGAWRAKKPVAIFCKTDACQVWFSGPARRSWVITPGGSVPGSRFVAERDTVIIDEVSARTRGILAHELVHVELMARARGAPLPQWLHEGLAASVGDAPVCEPTLAAGVADLRTLDSNAAWAAYTSDPTKIHATYCQARREAEAWIEKYGFGALDVVFAALARGTDFDAVYGPLLTTAPSRRPRFATIGKATIVVDGTAASHVALAKVGELSAKAPFTIALDLKPEASAGIVAQLSTNADGTGWCTPILGYDSEGKLVAQLLHGHSGDASSYAVTRTRIDRAKWSHVELRWTPERTLQLAVDGRVVDEAPAAAINLPETPMQLTLGSASFSGDEGCWHGAIASGAFKGELRRIEIARE